MRLCIVVFIIEIFRVNTPEERYYESKADGSGISHRIIITPELLSRKDMPERSRRRVSEKMGKSYRIGLWL